MFAYYLLIAIIGLMVFSWFWMDIIYSSFLCEIDDSQYAELASLAKEYPSVRKQLNLILKHNEKVSVRHYYQMLVLVDEFLKQDIKKMAIDSILVKDNDGIKE